MTLLSGHFLLEQLDLLQLLVICLATVLHLVLAYLLGDLNVFGVAHFGRIISIITRCSTYFIGYGMVRVVHVICTVYEIVAHPTTMTTRLI